MKRRAISIHRLERSFIYRPLAAILIILLLPMFSRFEGDTGIRVSQASAQSLNNNIIQTYCSNGINCPYTADLVQLETDGVNAYLGLHNLPAEDAHIIYDYGREDLRDGARGAMFNILLGIIYTPASGASGRTTHQQNLYNWLQGLVQQNEIAEYTQALNQFNLWQGNPCTFTLDSDIAKQYNISYDGTPFCFSSLSGSFSGPQVPAENYFTAYGLKYSYGKPALTFPYFAALVADTGVNVYDAEAMAATAIALIVTGVDFAIAPSVLAAVAIIANASIDWGATGALGQVAVIEASQTLAGTVADVAAGLEVIGAAAIVLAAVAIGVSAGMQVFDNQQTINDLNNLNNTLAQAKNTPPNLSAMANDTSGIGMYKLQSTFDAQTVPDVTSTATLPSHQASDLNFAIQKSTVTTPTISSTLAYQDWNGVNWSAQTSGGWAVQNCTSSSGCPQADSMIAGIRYVDWSGVNWAAHLVGDKFLSVKNKPASTDVVCQPDQTGVSPGPNFSNCASYVSKSIPLQDPNGVLETVSLSVLTPPVFGSPLPNITLPFAPGVPSTQTFMASGNPTPQICYYSSTPALPADFTANGSSLTTTNCTTNGTFSLQFNGNSSSSLQNYQLTLAASNADTPNAVLQTFDIDVGTTLAITSPSVINGNAGVPLNFRVTTTGVPPPALSTDISIPGITFTDNGNGTGTFSGIPGPDFLTCINNLPGCNITASSSQQGTVSQLVAIQIPPAPSPSLSQPTSGTFIAGAPNSVVLTSTGATTPISWSFSASVPSWLNLHDNGNGTATLFGTPPVGTSGPFSIPLELAAAYTQILTLTDFPVTVENIPVFLSPNTTSFTVGTQSSFQVRANQGSLGVVETLPTGLSLVGDSLQCDLQNIDGACLLGTPAAGTGGQHILTLTDNAGAAGSASQSLTVNIYEAPQITSPSSATFFTGMPSSFAVTTSGYPSLSTQPVPPGSTPPTSPGDGKGMYFTVNGLPGDLHFSNLNPEGFAGGTLTIEGTPSTSDAGLQQVQITAQNGVGAIAKQTLALNIIKITGPAPVSGAQCNGAYNGTFSGNVTVSAGQNCMFLGGGVTGNVTVNGGNLVLTNATVSGNITAQGSSAFSIGTGTTIGKNLSLQNIASGVSMNQVCGTKVAGSVTVYANATPVQLGSTGVTCPGNSFGGVSVTYDSAATDVYNNKVAKNLSCSNNASISGGGNNANKKLGQCASF